MAAQSTEAYFGGAAVDRAAVKVEFQQKRRKTLLADIADVHLWPHIAGDAGRAASVDIDRRAVEIEAMGQARACRGRVLDEDHIEIVAWLLTYLAIKQLVAEAWTSSWASTSGRWIRKAFQVAAAEATNEIKLAPIDRAVFL